MRWQGETHNYAKGRKDFVLQLRSGERLHYSGGYLTDCRGYHVAALSASGKGKLKTWTDKGYEITGAKASHIVAWRPIGSETEHAVCLPVITLSKKQGMP